jgi:hypothetical protein
MSQSRSSNTKSRRFTYRFLFAIMSLIVLMPVAIYVARTASPASADSFLGFNEGYGTTVSDALSTISGTISGAAWKPEELCFFGKCLYFDGVNDYVSFGDDADLDFAAADSFTISFWFRTPAIASGTRVMVAKYNAATGSDGGYKIYMNSEGKVCFGIDDDNTWGPDDSACSNERYDTATWQYLSAVKTSTSKIELFINGIRVAVDSSLAATGTLVNTDAFYLGIDGNGTSNPYLGYMDEFKVSNSAKTETDIKADLVTGSTANGTAVSFGPDQSFPSNGLLTYWKMDEASGNAVDSSGNGYTLTNNGTTTYVGGKFGNGSEHVPASAQHFSTASTISGVKSVAFWTNPDSTTNYFVALNASTSITAASGVLSATGFTSPKIYVNGVASTTIVADTWQLVTVTSDTAINADQFYVGRVGSNYFDGTMDEARTYNQVLSPAEIQKLYSWAPGPIAHWKFDENMGKIAYDTSGNNNTTNTFTNDVSWAPGIFGSGLVFDGVDDAVVIDNNSTISLGATTESYTVMAWFRTNKDYSSTGTIINKWNSTAGTYPFWIGFNATENVFMGVWDGSFDPTINSPLTYNDNKWHHVAGVRDVIADKIYLYIDGVLVNSTTDTTTQTMVNTNPICIGNAGSGNCTAADFQGNIDDVRIYRYARTPAQIIEDMNAGHPAPGSPVGSAYLHYKLDEGNGTTANNSGNAGSTINGTIGSGTWTQSGKFGKAVTFSASTSITATITDPGSTNTLSLWVYPTTSAASKTLITSGKLTTDSSSRPVYGGCVGTALAVDSWTHIVAVSNGSSACTLYQNGKLTASGGTGVTFGTSVNIGGSSFTGTIDEVKLYSLAMSADQVNVEFAGGFAGVWGSTSTTSTGEGSFSAANEYCPPGQTTSCTPPVAHWKFDENTGTTTTFDSSGNENHGAMSNFTQASWIPGKLGSALNFNNTSTRINAGSGSSLDDMSALTVAGWFYVRSSSTGEDVITAKATRSFSDITNGWFFGVQSISDYLSFRANFSSTTLGVGTFTNSVPNNEWVHLTVSWNGSTSVSGVNFYVNGVSIPKDGGDNGSGSRVSDAAQNLFIGSDSLTERQFDGHMDDLRIYNYVRTPEQISWDMNRGKPLAWYKFDECSGDIAYNSISSLYPGTISAGGSGTNSIVGTCEGGTGMRGNAATAARGAGLDFDGTNDFVNLGNVFRFTSSMSVEAWVYLKSGHTGRETYFVNKHGGSGARDWTLQDEYGGLAFKVSHDGSNMCYVYSSINPAIEVWTHVVGTYDATNQRLKIFVNGTDASGSANACPYSTITASNNNVWIGGRQSNSSYAQAKIDEVKIYGYALSPIQVKGAFNDSSSAVRFGN